MYDILCGLLSITALTAGYGVYRAHRALSQRVLHERIIGWAMILVLALLLFGNYLFFYPLAVRILPMTSWGSLLSLFVPVEWLYDHPPCEV